MIMPDMSEFQNHILLKKEKSNSNVAWYENGMLKNVSPRDERLSLDENRQVAYDARYIISDGIKYDLYNPKDIMNITVPRMLNPFEYGKVLKNEGIEIEEQKGMEVDGVKFGGIGLPYVTRELPYLLQMRVKKIFSKELAVPLAFKASELMMASTTDYGKDGFERMAIQLYAVNADTYAEYLEGEFKRLLPFYTNNDFYHTSAFDQQMDIAKQSNQDYIEMPYQATACAECAKYMGRIYSISGNDRRFPKLPKEIIEKKQIHEGCHCSFWAISYREGYTLDKWVFGENGDIKQVQVDAIKSSNRPFVDDRCEQAKIRYNQFIEKRNNGKKSGRTIEEWKVWGINNAEYEWIEDNLPEICPKTISVFTKAKKTRSKKYLELKAEALKLGKALNDGTYGSNNEDVNKAIISNEEKKNNKATTDISNVVSKQVDSIFQNRLVNFEENLTKMKPNYCRELHETYIDSITAFYESYPEADQSLLKQIDNYSRYCALYLWHLFGTNIDDCVLAVNEIYSSSTDRTDYTKEEIEAAMSRISTKDYSMSVPKFFWSIIDFDKKNDTNYSRLLAVCFKILDIVYAMIDEKVEPGEADIIEKLQGELVKACDSESIYDYPDDVKVRDYINDLESEKLVVVAGDKKISSNDSNIKAVNVKKNDNKKNDNSTKETNNTIDELDSLIGLVKAKREIHEVANFAKIQKARLEQGLPVSEVSFHLVFTGNPGTGKTTVARLVAQIYKELGIVSKGHLIEASAKDLVAGYVGQTAIKTGEIIEKAMGGVLFIDEAYTLLDKTGQGYGQEAIDTLLKEMEDHRDDFVVIVAGYDDPMKDFINSNPGLKSRFNKYIHFDDYTPEEMCQIFGLLCSKGAYTCSQESLDILKEHFKLLSTKSDNSFANGRTVRNVFEKIISKQASRVATEKNITKEILSEIKFEDVVNSIGKIEKKEETLEDVLKELNSLIGLEQVKNEISELVYIVQNQQRRKSLGLTVPSLSLHLVFMGNPGTGKTTVARLIARIYKCLGLLSGGQLIETDRSGLVAGYVGQTAIKTQEVVKEAIGGVLFIDEAYTLYNGGANDFGQEAIDTLLKAMEDHRNDLVVIVAGYENLMGDFIQSNPGLESRFNRYIHFEDYTTKQLIEIFEGLCNKNQYLLSNEAKRLLIEYFEQTDPSAIGNGRGVRNIFEKIVTQQAKRIEQNTSADKVDVQLILEEDIRSVQGMDIKVSSTSEILRDFIVDEVEVSNEIQIKNEYSVDSLYPSGSDVGNLYSILKDIILSIEPNLEESAKKLYVSFKYDKKNTVSLWPKSGWIEVVLNAKLGQINDSHNIIYDISNRKWSSEQYAFKFYPNTDLAIVKDIIEQTINLKR